MQSGRFSIAFHFEQDIVNTDHGLRVGFKFDCGCMSFLVCELKKTAIFAQPTG